MSGAASGVKSGGQEGSVQLVSLVCIADREIKFPVLFPDSNDTHGSVYRNFYSETDSILHKGGRNKKWQPAKK